MAEHTKTPWRNACFQVYGSDNSRIAHTGMGLLPPSRSSESEANAAFIVKATNHFDDLVAALTKSRQWVEANTAQVRGMSAQAAAPGEAMLAEIDAILTSIKES